MKILALETIEFGRSFLLSHSDSFIEYFGEMFGEIEFYNFPVSVGRIQTFFKMTAFLFLILQDTTSHFYRILKNVWEVIYIIFLYEISQKLP